MEIKQLKFNKNSLADKIVKNNTTLYKLWLEFEESEPWEDLDNDYANIGIDTLDGRYFGLNVWTEIYAAKNELKDEDGNLVPDLIVERLTRECIEKNVNTILDSGKIGSIVTQSNFALKFISPYVEDINIDLPIFRTIQKNIFTKSKIKISQEDIIATREDKSEMIIEIDDGRIIVIELLEKSENYKIYCNKLHFWETEMGHQIQLHKNS